MGSTLVGTVPGWCRRAGGIWASQRRTSHGGYWCGGGSAFQTCCDLRLQIATHGLRDTMLVPQVGWLVGCCAGVWVCGLARRLRCVRGVSVVCLVVVVSGGGAVCEEQGDEAADEHIYRTSSERLRGG